MWHNIALKYLPWAIAIPLAQIAHLTAISGILSVMAPFNLFCATSKMSLSLNTASILQSLQAVWKALMSSIRAIFTQGQIPGSACKSIKIPIACSNKFLFDPSTWSELQGIFPPIVGMHMDQSFYPSRIVWSMSMSVSKVSGADGHLRARIIAE